MTGNEEAASRLDPSRRPTRSTKPCEPHSTAPQNRNARPQAAGQRKRAERLLEDASRVADLGDFRRARNLRHEARRLAALARGAA